MPSRAEPAARATLSTRIHRHHDDERRTVMAMDRVDAYLEAHRADFEEQLKALLRIPSVSAQPDHDADTRRAAAFVRDDLAAMGLEAELIETKRHPIVYAEWLGAPGKPTLLDLRPLRRPAARAAGALALAPVRADGPRRQPLRPRGDRRQGPDVHPPQGGRGLAQDGRAAAGQRQVPDRGRGGGRRGQPRGLRRRATPSGWPATTRSSPTPASSPRACPRSPTA